MGFERSQAERSAHQSNVATEASTRRVWLKALGAAAAGAVAGGLLSTRDALAHGSFHQDSNNADPAIHGNNSSSGPGVEGTGSTGPGVFGKSPDGPGVFGESTNNAGVAGSSSIGAGVSGFSSVGTAVEGRGHFGVAGVGFGRGVGVFASSIDGVALQVAGTAQFLTAESGAIPIGNDSMFVFNRRVSDKSHVTVTLAGSPGAVTSGFPALVQWVERQPGSGFVIHLTRKVAQETPFTYLIIETT